MYFLLTDPARLERVMLEIKQTLARRPDNENPKAHISWAESLQMPFLQACIKESLRLHPALGMVLPRVVPDPGVTICGVFIPGGTEVGCNAWTVHRDKDVYGPDADLFVPERWLDPDTEKVKMLERYNFAFGAGSRTCKCYRVAT
jgi:cytochrome P450